MDLHACFKDGMDLIGSNSSTVIILTVTGSGIVIDNVDYHKLNLW